MDKIKIILDTDLGADCGDAAALAISCFKFVSRIERNL